MAFASGGFHGLRYVRESEFGVIPKNPQLRNLRHTSCSLILSKDSFQSNELRCDAQISDLRHGNRRAQGDVGIEFSFGEFDDFLAAAVRGEWKDVADHPGHRELRAGVKMQSFTLERVFADIQQYEVFTGCEVDTLSLSIQTNAMVTGTLSFVGKNVDFSKTPLDSVPDTSLTAPPFDGFSGGLWEGGIRNAVVTSIELNIANNLDPAFVIGSDSAAAIVAGRINVTGTVSAYFENMDLLRKFVAEEESTLAILLGNGEKKSYTITLPRIKYSGGDNPVDGEGPITLSMPFQALYDSCEGTNIRIRRIAGPEDAPCRLQYSGTTFEPTSGGKFNDVEVTVTGGDGSKVFTGLLDGEVLHANVTGLPSGYTAKVIKVENKKAVIRLTSTSGAPTEGSFTVTFTAASFAFGFCHCPNSTIAGLSQTFTIGSNSF